MIDLFIIGTALKLLWNCSGTALGSKVNKKIIRLIINMKMIQSGLKKNHWLLVLHWYCTERALERHWNGTGGGSVDGRRRRSETTPLGNRSPKMVPSSSSYFLPSYYSSYSFTFDFFPQFSTIFLVVVVVVAVSNITIKWYNIAFILIICSSSNKFQQLGSDNVIIIMFYYIIYYIDSYGSAWFWPFFMR